MFGELPAEASFTRIEEDVRRFWRRYRLPEASRAARDRGLPYVLHQQPLAAVGQSWTDQVRLLAAADLFARYRSMRGDSVHRQVGWACHGLQVEVAVEQALGADAADYDLGQFNAACRDAAIQGLHKGELLAGRLGLWTDPGSTYTTLAPRTITAVWGALRRLWDAGQLRHARQIASVCPRCATPLSTAEAGRRAVEVEARSIWVHLPWDGEPNAYFLTWTPAPWTLIGMVALAAHPNTDYALVELPTREGSAPVRLLLAEPALERALTGSFRLVRRVRGKSLRQVRYRPPFTFLPAGEGIDRVVLSKDVALDQGTGLLPVTPAFDAPSLALAQAHDLPVPHLLDDRGSLEDSVARWRGLSPLDAEPSLVDDLRTRGLLYQEESMMQQRALCPYCRTPLLPLARSVWRIHTEHDAWILGRDRAWGTPLPVWACEQCGEQTCVAGLDDLAHRTGQDVDRIEPYRPAVDRLIFPCETCGGTMRRVAAVVDAGFETAVLCLQTAAQPGPADLAVGLGDRQYGWLGDLGRVAALLQGSLAWEQAAALPESEAQDAWDPERTPPADALRWAAYTDTTPDQAERDFLLPLTRIVVPLLTDSLPVEQEGMREDAGGRPLDRWLEARLHETIRAVTGALDTCDPRQAARELASLVDDISYWPTRHLPNAGAEVLEVLSRLLAPFVPYLAEAIHRQISGHIVESVHLTDWPTPDSARTDPALLAHMDQVWRLAALGQTARAQAGVDANRSLRQALIGLLSGDTPELEELAPFKDLLAEALGVAQVEFTPDAAARAVWQLDLYPGQIVERSVAQQEIETALANLGPVEAASLASQIWQGLSVSVEASGQAITLLPDEVRASVQPQPGLATAADAKFVIALAVG